MQRLLPDPGPIELSEQLAGYHPGAMAGGGRPFVYTNFAVTVDGHATIDQRSGTIGSDADTAILMGLRESADAVLVGAGTVRAENYGRLLPGKAARERRQSAGRSADPLAVIVGNSLNLPWDAGLFTSGAGEVVIFTASGDEPPETKTPVSVVRHPDGVDLDAALRLLHDEHGVRTLLSEGGPSLHGSLLEEGLVDELFITLGPKLAGGVGPRMAENLAGGPIELELRWLLQEGSELFARYAVLGTDRTG